MNGPVNVSVSVTVTQLSRNVTLQKKKKKKIKKKKNIYYTPPLYTIRRKVTAIRNVRAGEKLKLERG